MKNRNLNIVKKALSVSALLLIGLQATYSQAGLVSCGVADLRTAGLDSAQECKFNYGNGTDRADDIKAAFAPAAPDTAWTEVGHVNEDKGGFFFGAGALRVTMDRDWNSGTWEILDADFWTKGFSSAVIAMHVIGGARPNRCPPRRLNEEDAFCAPPINTPTNFEWLLTANAMSGTWEYSNSDIRGFSNWTLWGSGEGTPPVGVPEPSSILLFALGLIGLVYVRRKSA